jgi:uncharacterized protein (TIGR04255 family)
MSVKYQKAPISEVIFGVIFDTNLLARNSILFEIITELKKEYPILQTSPTIFEEDLQENKLFQNINPDTAGFSLYRLMDNDRKLIVQLQQNFLVLNWVRSDDHNVGSYLGFTHLFEEFKKLFKLIQTKFESYNPETDIFKHIKSFTLHYQDRVFFKEYIDDFSQISDLIAMQLPVFKLSDNYSVPPNNIFSKFTTPLPSINGYSIISINTGVTLPSNQQILVVECRMKGKFAENSLDKWFEEAHKTQIIFFENFFNQKRLEEWQ